MEQPYKTPYHARPGKRRHRRKNGLLLASRILMLALAVALFAVVGTVLANDIQENDKIEFLDTDPPEISGISDFTIYEGDTIAYRSGVSVTDDLDPQPVLRVDSSQVDLNSAGTYPVTYTAADASGNQSQAQATVTVLAKKEGYVDLETIYSAADARLALLITEDMTTYEQVKAIYVWARLNLSYGGSSDRADWRQTAYGMLTTGKGDCYGFFAVTKLLFERLGIPNIDVQKVRNFADDNDHFWSLVSVDGGKSYYHFDATPRVGDGDDFCLVTDAFLDAYSAEHRNCHNRDKALYPATPEEAL